MSKPKVSSMLSNSLKPNLKIGDLLWCRETKNGQLWWPAMVTYDPKAGIYFRKSAQYHVQYFGISAVRGWVFQGSIQPFTDPTEKTPSKGMSKKVHKEYDVAIKEVTEALSLDHKQRKLRFIFNFTPQTNSKRKKTGVPKMQPTTEDVKVDPPTSTQSAKKRTETAKTSSGKTSEGAEDKNTRRRNCEETKKTSSSVSPGNNKALPTPNFVVPEPEKASKALGNAMEPEPVGIPIVTAEIIPSPSKPLILSYSPVPQCVPFPVLVNPMNMAIPDPIFHSVAATKPGLCTCARCLENYSKSAPPLMAINMPQVSQLGLSYHPNGSMLPIVKYSPGMICPTGPSVANPGNQLPVPLLHSLQGPVSLCMGQNPMLPLPNMIRSDNSITPIASPVKRSEPNRRPDKRVAPSQPSTARVHAPSSLTESSSSESNARRRSSRKRPSISSKPLDDEVINDDLEIPIPAKKLALAPSILDSSPNDNSSEISTPSTCMPSAILTPPTSSAEESSSIDLEFDRSRMSVTEIFPVTSQPKKPKKQSVKPKDEEPTFNSGVCCICDQEDDDLLPCEGHCYNLFHLDCLGLIQVPNFKFVCDECLLASSKCFTCGKSDGKLIKCNKTRCPKLYHMACVEGNKLASFDERKKTTFVCPLHVCARCTSIGTTKVTHSNLLQCTRCPLALHRPDCLIAGCELLNQMHMICYQHVEIKAKQKIYTHQNLNTCLECGQTGDVYCCDVCSAAYHMECLEDDAQPQSNSESWKCPNCAVHDLPMYGAMVICKFGFWRWWPSEVIHPKDVPDNIVTKKPGDCMFVVRFCGSQDYSWTYHGRALSFTGAGEEIACKTKGRTSTDAAYHKACTEALELYRTKKIAKEEREAKLKPDSKHYTKIRINKYLVPRPQPDSESLDFLPCQCTAQNPCNDDSICVNRAVHIECDPRNCPVGKLCQNQRIKRLEGAKTNTFYTGTRGWGLKANHDLKAGDYVVEYVGEVLDTEMCKERLQKYHENNATNFYMLTLEGGLVIDASQKSNHARFINHSCNPNCESQKWRVRGEARIGIFARYDIPKDTELTFDYHLDSLGNEKKRCLCGSRNCSGFLGVKSARLQTSRPKPKKKKVKSKESRMLKKHKVKQEDAVFVDTHEDDCFLCKDGGELLLCDRKGCSKAYHLQCLTRKTFPSKSEKWECPRHYCQVCQKLADTFCSICPVSYCSKHNQDKFTKQTDSDELVCILFCKQIEKQLTSTCASS